MINLGLVGWYTHKQTWKYTTGPRTTAFSRTLTMVSARLSFVQTFPYRRGGLPETPFQPGVILWMNFITFTSSDSCCFRLELHRSRIVQKRTRYWTPLSYFPLWIVFPESEFRNGFLPGECDGVPVVVLGHHISFVLVYPSRGVGRLPSLQAVLRYPVAKQGKPGISVKTPGAGFYVFGYDFSVFWWNFSFEDMFFTFLQC